MKKCGWCKIHIRSVDGVRLPGWCVGGVRLPEWGVGGVTLPEPFLVRPDFNEVLKSGGFMKPSCVTVACLRMICMPPFI